MAARSSWKGHIQFSLINVPVRAYNAVSDESKISFNQLHAKCNARIKQNKICSACGEVVEKDELVSGYMTGKDVNGNEQFVQISDDEKTAVKVASNKIVQIEAFVRREEISLAQFEAPFYLGPDGDAAKQTFALLTTALKKSGKAGIGKIVLSGKEEIVAIMTDNHTRVDDSDGSQLAQLMMYKIRRPERLKDDIYPATVEIGDMEVTVAMQLIDGMTKEFDKINLGEDRFSAELRKMIDAKVAGKEYKIAEIAEPVAKENDLLTQLKTAVAAQKKS